MILSIFLNRGDKKHIIETIKSNNYLTYIYTTKEERLKSILVNVSNKLSWDFIEGYKISQALLNHVDKILQKC
uniref:Uncharacterized protein n=1 Tax=Polysiphonia infestans TaxID=2006978 RepID=A0A1Z1MEK8_9FLOR|nr:hypothetical protein [Polysiphonia infestans]ARW64265.1 hypothetical protein [Polysiphonia infestans]